MDSLNGAVWFIVLDLMSGYWQVEMDEASKPLMAFTVGPLGFYVLEADGETCLGDLQFNWCFIYLDNVIVFSKMPKEHLAQLRAVFEKLKKQD